MIIGITNDDDGRVIQRLSVTTKVAIGLPPSGDKNYPQKLDHFVFLRKPSDSLKGTLWEQDPLLAEHYKNNPREVEIILLDDELENVFKTRMAWFTKSQLKCWGDGAEAVRRTEQFPNGQPWTPCGQSCKDLQEGRCKPSGDLRFMLADFPRLGAIARIHTSSYRSIQQIHSSLQQVRIITGGRLAGIRATLAVRPEKTSYDDKGQRKSTTIFALSLEMKADGIHKLMDKMTETARLFEQTRKALGTGRIEVVEEDDEDTVRELQPEFYPQAPAVIAEQENQDAPPQVVARPCGADGFITQDQRTELYKLANRANVTHNDLVQWLSEHHGIESTSKITPEAAEAAAGWLKDVADTPIEEEEQPA